MPRTIDEGFRDFLSNLTPSTTETQAVKNHRASIEACLKSNFGLNRFARIGSFGNGTSISGYSDVDYLASLSLENQTLVSTSTLTKVKNTLDKRFPFTGVNVRSPAVVVPFGTLKVETSEIVPAFFQEEKNLYKIYEISDSSGGWMKVSPDAHNYYVRSVDEKLNWKVKPLIRFIKAWKYFRAVPISSFYLELRVAKYASEEQFISYEHDVRNIFKLLLDLDLSKMQDPMGFSGYISPCISEVAKTDALSKLNTAYTRAQKAVEESKNGNIAEAFDWWRLLYDNEFPTYYKRFE